MTSMEETQKSSNNMKEGNETVEIPIEAKLVKNRVVVWNPKAGSYLYKHGFYGKPVGIRKPKIPEFNRPLELSLLETAYLLEKNRIKLVDMKTGSPIKIKRFIKKAEDLHSEFIDKYTVYKDLRDRGRIVRPGLKFGADFAVYEHGPGIDHSPFIVHVLSESSKIAAIEMVRAGRLATTVRKKFIIATISTTGEPRYYAFTWFKP
ncbi:MAG: tRNA-intron lyase [Candidatus Hodarchaeota archaeon]